MFKKIAFISMVALMGTTVAHAADQETLAAKKMFETTMIKPCEGKKEGTQVQVTTPRGVTVMATCKMAAVVDIK